MKITHCLGEATEKAKVRLETTTENGMSTEDPPGSPSSPRSGGRSQEGTQEADHEERCDLTISDRVSRGLEEVGSKVISPKKIDLEGKDKESIQNTIAGGSKGSWVGAVQGQKVLRKYDVEVTMKDGIGSVTVPEEITKDAAPLWDDFLIGKFLDKAPHIAKVHAIVNKIWNLNDKTQRVEVYEVNDTSMKFKILNQADRNRVLRRGMWNLAGIPVVLTKWSPIAEKEKAPVQSIPMWVHIKNVPLNMISWQGLSFVTSPIGSLVRLHPETAQCLKLDVAKIFVKVDLTKDLPTKMNFKIDGKDVLIEYTYPKLPTKCSNCETWGHSVRTCNIGKNQAEEKQEKLEEGEIVNDPKEAEKVVENLVSVEISGEAKVNKEANISNEGSKKEIEVDDNKVEEKEVKENDWSDVTPGKSSRSPGRKELEFGSVTLLTKSRFSVLTPVGEEEETLDQVDKEEQSEEQSEEDTAKEDAIPRRMLPRESKQNHRYLKVKTSQKALDADPSYLNKKKPRRQ